MPTTRNPQVLDPRVEAETELGVGVESDAPSVLDPPLPGWEELDPALELGAEAVAAAVFGPE